MPLPGVELYPQAVGLYPGGVNTSLFIRARPPLRLSIDAETPNGLHYRWANDEKAANTPSGLDFSTTMPGGFETLSATLPRKPGVTYNDLDRLTTLTVLGAGGQAAGEYRLEASPRTSGNEMSVSPSAVGWQAHLADDKSATEIYVDQSFGSWGEPSVTRKLAWLTSGTGYTASGPSTIPDATTGAPSLETNIEDTWVSGGTPIVEGWYDAHGVSIGSVYYAWKKSSNLDNTDTNFIWAVHSATDDTAVGDLSSGNLSAAPPGTGTLTPTNSPKFAFVEFRYNTAAGGNAGIRYSVFWTRLAVYGAHGLPLRGTADATTTQGLYASDVVAHAVRQWAPLLNLTEGVNGSVTPTAFVIPQLTFLDPTTASEIVSAANRYHLRDWAVWENRTFHYHDRGATGRKWRARISPAQLEETGPSIDRLWNGIVVRFQDVDGSTRTVGPTGSGADTEDASLLDTDPLNPANEVGIRRWEVLDMGGVSTPAGATEVGRRFLTESALLNTSGRARLVGYVTDDRGVVHPAWKVRAGDTISFIDAADTSERRIVRTSYSDSDKTNSVDLDSPPEGLDALLERLQAVLIPLGIG